VDSCFTDDSHHEGNEVQPKKSIHDNGGEVSTPMAYSGDYCHSHEECEDGGSHVRERLVNDCSNTGADENTNIRVIVHSSDLDDFGSLCENSAPEVSRSLTTTNESDLDRTRDHREGCGGRFGTDHRHDDLNRNRDRSGRGYDPRGDFPRRMNNSRERSYRGRIPFDGDKQRANGIDDRSRNRRGGDVKPMSECGDVRNGNPGDAPIVRPGNVDGGHRRLGDCRDRRFRNQSGPWKPKYVNNRINERNYIPNAHNKYRGKNYNPNHIPKFLKNQKPRFNNARRFASAEENRRSLVNRVEAYRNRGADRPPIHHNSNNKRSFDQMSRGGSAHEDVRQDNKRIHHEGM